jgi:hypothetical protein
MFKGNWPRGAVSTRLVVGLDPDTDEGRAKAFFNGAYECLIGAKKLDEGFSDLAGEYILTLHALELGLKSFLANVGMTDEELSRYPYAHNLENLYDEAARRGLAVSMPKARNFVEWLNVCHDRGALLRYDFMHARELPMCKVIFPIIEKILTASR